jgi:hypothetical protein
MENTGQDESLLSHGECTDEAEEFVESVTQKERKNCNEDANESSGEVFEPSALRRFGPGAVKVLFDGDVSGVEDKRKAED